MCCYSDDRRDKCAYIEQDGPEADMTAVPDLRPDVGRLVRSIGAKDGVGHIKCYQYCLDQSYDSKYY